MNDIFVAMGVMFIVSATLGVTVAKSQSPQGGFRVVAMSLLLLGAFGNVFYSTGRIVWAAYIPDSAVIVWANLIPVATAIAAGLAFRLPNRPRWRQFLASGLLMLLSLGSLAWPVLGMIFRPAQPGGNTWIDSVAMQTSWASCSPAAAATLLRAHGVSVDESDLIPVCLTDANGTVSLGLYRGVKIFSERNQLDVEVINGSLQQLIERDDWPVLLLVRLPKSGVDDPRYEQQWGWIPGLGHSVVAFGRTRGGDFLIGDPAIGRELWSQEDMQVLWHGEGIRLHKRLQSATTQTQSGATQTQSGDF